MCLCTRIFIRIVIHVMFVSGFDSRWSRHPTRRCISVKLIQHICGIYVNMCGIHTTRSSILWIAECPCVFWDPTMQTTRCKPKSDASVCACTLALCCLYSHVCSQVINKLVMTSRRKTQWPWKAGFGVMQAWSFSRWVHAQMKMHMTALRGKLSFKLQLALPRLHMTAWSSTPSLSYASLSNLKFKMRSSN